MVPGATLTSGKVLKADKARLETASGARFQVRIKETEHGGVKVKLRDFPRSLRFPAKIRPWPGKTTLKLALTSKDPPDVTRLQPPSRPLPVWPYCPSS